MPEAAIFQPTVDGPPLHSVGERFDTHLGQQFLPSMQRPAPRLTVPASKPNTGRPTTPHPNVIGEKRLAQAMVEAVARLLP
jgi:hypothetical protein